MQPHSSSVALRAFLLGAVGVGTTGVGSIAAFGCGAPSIETTGLDSTGAPPNRESGAKGLDGCTNPEPLRGSSDTGVFSCDEGFLHRAEARICPSELPRDQAVRPSAEGTTNSAGEADRASAQDECSRDADCDDPLEHCELVDPNAGAECGAGYGSTPAEPVARCVRGCREDADCAGYTLCLCASPIGQCVDMSPFAGCKSDADCNNGEARCLGNARDEIDAPFEFACELPGDQCDDDTDCLGRGICRMKLGGRTCELGPQCGRPFLVAAEARLAPARATDAWLQTGEGLRSGATQALLVSPELARQLARHWTQVGLMEHASIAAFARFTLQLLAMGAPAELIEESNRAQADETRHARLAFELATHYACAPVGPGPLSLDGPLLDADWEAILLTTIEEGCIGETCAAIEAAHASSLCSDPAVSQTLERIAADEGRHAALAWRTVRWMLDARPSLTPLAQSAFDAAAHRVPPTQPTLPLSPQTPAEHHGALETATRDASRQTALRDVVTPCAKALFEALLQSASAATAKSERRPLLTTA